MDSDCCPVDQSASAPTASTLSDSVPANAASEVEVSSLTVSAPPGSEAEDVDTYNPIEPPPLDWRSDSSSEAGSADDLDDPSLPPSADSLDKTSLGESVLSPLDVRDILIPLDVKHRQLVADIAEPVQDAEVELEEEDEAVEVELRADGLEGEEEEQEEVTFRETETNISEEVEVANRRSNDEDHSRIHTLLSQLQLMGEEPHLSHQTPPHGHYSNLSELEACAPSLLTGDGTETTGLLFSESHQRDLLGLLQCTEMGTTPGPTCLPHRGEVDAVVSVSYSQEDTQRFWGHYGHHERQRHREDSLTSLPDDEYPEPVWMKLGEEPPEREAAAESEQSADEQPSYKNVPGPCDPEDLLDGVIFGAKYLGSTQIKSEKNPWTNAGMAQAQEAVDRIKAPEGGSQPMTEVDLFISTQRIKVLTADTQDRIFKLEDTIEEMEKHMRELQEENSQLLSQVHSDSRKIKSQEEHLQAYREMEATNKRLQDSKKELEVTNKRLLESNSEMAVVNKRILMAYKEIQATNQRLQDSNKDMETTNKCLPENNRELEEKNKLLCAVHW